MNIWALVSFISFTGIVALISFLKTRRETTRTTTGLFFANRNNNFWVIGGALFLSNISANQLIGENQSIYIDNMSVMAWGVSSVLAMLLVAKYVLPIYFKSGAMTIPDFLGMRYDHSTKRLVSLIFLVSYLVNLLPSVLYGGAVAFTGMFNVLDVFELTYWQQIWVMVWVIGVIGAIYSILGGLRAITISDSVLSIGLFIIGLAFPYFGFIYLGDGNWLEGIERLLTSNTEHLNAIGRSGDEIPFDTIFTGMFIMNLYYWGMEQYIVQQAMTAKSLSESQKGMALACVGKLFCPFLINIPGLIGVHLYGNLENTAEVFPLVVKDTLPAVLTGLTAAVVLGAAITTFNAGLTSSSTLFTLTFFKPIMVKRGRKISEKRLVRASKRFEITVSILAMLTAPFIIFANTSFYTYLQQLSGMFSVPIFTIILMGFISKKVSAVGAKAGLLIFIFGYLVTNYILDLEIHYLHLLALLFLITAGFMLLLSSFQKVAFKSQETVTEIKVVPWNNLHYVGGLLILFMVLTFLLFSPLGIA